MEHGCRIPLGKKARFALVDREDFEWLSQFRWYATSGGGRYACRYAMVAPGKKRWISMHREITKAPAGVVVDHANGDTFDNRRCNLRLCTQSQNLANNRQRIGVSGYRGVSRTVRGNKWAARLHARGRNTHLGVFGDARDAARAYDRAARITFGEFARLNFPEEAP